MNHETSHLTKSETSKIELNEGIYHLYDWSSVKTTNQKQRLRLVHIVTLILCPNKDRKKGERRGDGLPRPYAIFVY